MREIERVEVDQESFRVEETKVRGLPTITLIPIARKVIGRLLIVYGGTFVRNFRYTVKAGLGEALAHAGFIVHMFDFSSNLGEDKGTYELRCVETLRVAHHFAEQKGHDHKLSVLGISMGGPMAIKVPRFIPSVSRLVLVAPAAYNLDVEFNVGFGPVFSEIIRRPNSWKNSASFDHASGVTNPTLIMGWRDDEVVSTEVIGAYANSFPRPTISMNPGGHKGHYDNPEKIGVMVDIITAFFVG